MLTIDRGSQLMAAGSRFAKVALKKGWDFGGLLQPVCRYTSPLLAGIESVILVMREAGGEGGSPPRLLEALV